MSQRNTTYFISDLHLGASYLDTRQSEQKVIDWLNSIKSSAKRLIFLGDILDYWYEYRHVVPRGYIRFFGKLAELSDSGIEIHWFTGNHDIWIFDYLPAELGITLHRTNEVLDIDGHSFFLSHGDEVGERKWSFRFIQWLFRNKVAQWCYSWIHPDLTMILAHKWSSSSRKKNNQKGEKHFRGEKYEPLVRFAKEYIKNNNVEYLIFGHRHILLDLMLTRNNRMVILGDWIKHFSYASFDGENLWIDLFEPEDDV
ncbi:MAG: UDP-2,3-diacylglucosamine diphosphatase [Bacteroidaceae bacterium]|nr:UDP-2,3-diacylglucosamine diphosphatase [Bacteroidaceae bacterium]